MLFPFTAGIFKGNYGSARENELESQLDILQEKKQRIGVARYKWNNGKILLQHAVNQMCFGVKKWGELSKINSRYKLTCTCFVKYCLVLIICCNQLMLISVFMVS